MGGLEASIVRARIFTEDLRFDAQFFRRAYLAEDQALIKHDLWKVGSFAFVTDGPHGYHEVDENSSIAMLTAKCASNWFAERDGADTIAKWVDDANKRSSLAVNDLILSTRGTVGACALVTEEALPANLDQDVARISMLGSSPFQPLFVLSYLNSRFGQDHIARHSSGMVQQGVSLAKVREIPVPLLSDRMQHRIAETVESGLRLRRKTRFKQKQAEDMLTAALGLRNWTPPEPLAYSAKSADVFAAARLDAQYFMPAKRMVRDALAQLRGKTLGERFLSVRDMFDPKDAPPGTLVRNYDVTDALQPLLDDEKEPEETDAIGSIKKVFFNGDVAMSRLRAYLREIAVVRTSGKLPAIVSSEFIVLRPRESKRNKIAPETLLTFLRSAPVQTILKWCQDGSQHPRFSEGDLLSIPVPNSVADASPRIEAIVKQGFASRQSARDLLDSAKRAVEIAIEDSEAAALAFLDDAAAEAMP
ncbi:MAG: hypothetical protein WCK65_10500, partial [Rhodospirillaceae bacterium]